MMNTHIHMDKSPSSNTPTNKYQPNIVNSKSVQESNWTYFNSVLKFTYLIHFGGMYMWDALKWLSCHIQQNGG